MLPRRDAGEPAAASAGPTGVRGALVVALVMHAAVLAWVAPQPLEPQLLAIARRPPREQPPAPPPDEPIAVVLIDEPAPRATTATTRAPVHVERIAVRAAAANPPATAAATSDAAPPAPAHRDGYFAMRRPSLAVPLDERPTDEPAPAAAPAAPSGELRPSGHGTFQTDLGGSDWRDRTATAHVARDGTVQFDNAPDFDIHFAGLGIAGKFNVDDWLERKHGIDPYASAKLAYLDRTRDERARIADANRADDLAHAPQLMQRNIAAAVALADPSARKQALFELWDDVAETGDDALVRAGADARAYLVGELRAMRATTEFTTDDIARLNAHRQSRAVFAPYD